MRAGSSPAAPILHALIPGLRAGRLDPGMFPAGKRRRLAIQSCPPGRPAPALPGALQKITPLHGTMASRIALGRHRSAARGAAARAKAPPYPPGGPILLSFASRITSASTRQQRASAWLGTDLLTSLACAGRPLAAEQASAHPPFCKERNRKRCRLKLWASVNSWAMRRR